MARMQDRCGEAARISKSLSSSEESCEKGPRSMIECSIGGNGAQCTTMAAEVIAFVEDLATTDTTEVTREEVDVAVRELKNGKALGSDEIVAELVKNGGKVMVDWFWELLREVWRTKRVPQEWKNAILIPLHKKQSRKDCNNYRGIALLSVPGKVLSLILHCRP